MPRQGPTPAQITKMAQLIQQQGTPIRAVRMCANGDVFLLTETPADVLASDDLDKELKDWSGKRGFG